MATKRTALVLLMLCAAPAPALARGAQLAVAGTELVGGGIIVLGGSSTPSTPGGGPQSVGTPSFGGPPGLFVSSGATTAPVNDNRLDEKWGTPLNATVYDSETMHAGVNYYYDNGAYGGQGAVGFSLTFKN